MVKDLDLHKEGEKAIESGVCGLGDVLWIYALQSPDGPLEGNKKRGKL